MEIPDPDLAVDYFIKTFNSIEDKYAPGTIFVQKLLKYFLKGMLPCAERQQLNHPLMGNIFLNNVIGVSLSNDHVMSLHYLKVKETQHTFGKCSNNY